MRNVALSISALLLVAFIATSMMILISSKSPEKVEVERTSLEEAVIEDAKKRFEGADIVDILKVEERDGNEFIVVRVTYNYSSMCPERKHVYYTYPEGLFLPEYPVRAITDCNLCKEGPCLVIYEEEAIAASLNIPGTEEVRRFVQETGAVPLPKKTGNVWQVTWLSEDKGYRVVFTENGKLIDISLINTTQ